MEPIRKVGLTFATVILLGGAIMAADQVNFTIKATTGGEETEEFEENQTQEEVQKQKKTKLDTKFREFTRVEIEPEEDTGEWLLNFDFPEATVSKVSVLEYRLATSDISGREISTYFSKRFYERGRIQFSLSTSKMTQNLMVDPLKALETIPTPSKKIIVVILEDE